MCRKRAAVCERRSRRCALLPPLQHFERDTTGHDSVAQPRGIYIGRRSERAAHRWSKHSGRILLWRRQPEELSIRKPRPQFSAGPDFLWSDFYLTKWFSLTEHVKLRFESQFFNVFNHPNFGLPSVVQAGIPGQPSTQTGFGSLTYTTSPPTGLLGVGLGGDSTPRMIAFQARLEF